MGLSPSLWQTNAGYCKAQKKLKTMKVVNDVAERGVALIQDYIHVITKDEEQRQFLLQVFKNEVTLYIDTLQHQLYSFKRQNYSHAKKFRFTTESRTLDTVMKTADEGVVRHHL
ncbi:hypothetical protein Hamer_G029240 [Homarus americanus]|uniref:Uncharacterized protein n=1 Tax=Homarus americanus TaxID=6706 RepID=A0A8J5T9S9_HOMAM|nr:hypothetical protein Hamer_G029240 [Homarus americanus]